MTQMAEFRVAMIFTCSQKGLIFHYKAYRQTCTDSGSHIRSLLANWSLPLALFHELWICIVSKQHSGKADQSTLASGGGEHAQLFSVAISWGNKISVCMQTCLVFSDSHILNFHLGCIPLRFCKILGDFIMNHQRGP